MKILPVIICGGAGTRLFPESKNYLPKQFVDFGNWNMFQKTLERINSSIYLPPIISTNIKYLSLVKKYLKKYQVKKYNIVLEPVKKNTAPAILATSLLDNIKSSQPMIFLPSDQLIESKIKFNAAVKKYATKIRYKDIFIFKGYIEEFGNVPYCAYITKKNVSQNKIVDFLNKNLVSSQIPKKFKYFRKFPRLGNNKIDKIKIINTF